MTERRCVKCGGELYVTKTGKAQYFCLSCGILESNQDFPEESKEKKRGYIN